MRSNDTYGMAEHVFKAFSTVSIWLAKHGLYPNNQNTSPPQEGRSAMAMDIKFGGDGMDLATPQGFISALYQACRLSPGSGFLAAPVCSSFVYMTPGTNIMQSQLQVPFSL